MSDKHKYAVQVEVIAMMAADGSVLIEEQELQLDTSNMEPVKDWCDDSDPYMLDRPSAMVTCGVARMLIKENSKDEGQGTL